MVRVWTLCAACVLFALTAARGEDTMLFDFGAPDAEAAWSQAKHVNAPADLSVTGVDFFIDVDPASGRKCLSLAFGYDAGWSAVGTTKFAVQGNWKEFKTLKLDLTVEKPLVAYIRILQGKPDDKGNQPYYERTMILQPGANPMTLPIRGVMDPARGDVTGFLIGAFRPEKPQRLLVDNVRLSSEPPRPNDTSWWGIFNHDGYSAAAQREFARTGKLPRFKVLGTDMDVANFGDLSRKLRDKWVQPEPKIIDQVEASFKAEFDKLKAAHPKAVMAIFRDGEKGWDAGNPDKVYAGWKMVYISCHGPDGPNGGRENTPALSGTIEAFMRHRSPLMQADLSSIPKGSTVLAARLVVTREGAPGAKDSERTPFKPNLWVAEPCNRDWDPASANCYFYATGKLWKAVSGLYYGEDPDYWPVFIACGPSGTGEVSDWDFTQALRFWTDGQHDNHGFFLYGDSVDYMKIYTLKAKDVKRRPAIMVVYEP